MVPRRQFALVLVTEWDAFRDLDFKRLKTVMASPVIIDLRNVYQPGDATSQGFSFSGVGRPAPSYAAELEMLSTAAVPSLRAALASMSLYSLSPAPDTLAWQTPSAKPREASNRRVG